MAHLRKIVFFLLGLLLLERFCVQKTYGFSLERIRSNLEYKPEWETEGTLPNEALSQPYHFLDSGAQAFAFVSEDGETVIKFFRHHRTRHPLAPLKPLLPSAWKAHLQHTIDKRHLKRVKDFTSYLIAYNTLKEETGLIYLHLNKSDHLGHSITLYDPIGVRHRINLDDHTFLVQRRATPLYPALEGWIEEGRLDLAQESLAQLVALLSHRQSKGIYDKDPDLSTNFGVIGTTPIQFDIGRFKTDIPLDPDSLIRITDRLACWLDEKEPSLAAYLRHEVETK